MSDNDTNLNVDSGEGLTPDTQPTTDDQTPVQPNYVPPAPDLDSALGGPGSINDLENRAASTPQVGAVAQAAQQGQQPTGTTGGKSFVGRVVSALENHLLGAGEGLMTRGIPGAIVGAANPNIPAQQISDAQAMRAAKVRMANDQAADFAVKLAIDQHALSRLPIAERQAQESADADREDVYQKSGLTPIAAGPASAADQIVQNVMESRSDDGQNGVPPLAILHAPGGQVHVYDLSRLGTDNQTNYKALQDFANLSGIPAPSWQDWTNGKPAMRIALMDAKAKYMSPVAPSDPKAAQALIGRYESDLAAYQLRNPNSTTDNDPNISWFKNTISRLQQQGLQHFKNATNELTQAAVQKKTALAAVGPAKVENMVVGTMPDGSQVAGTAQDLQASGATGIVKLPAAKAGAVQDARTLIAPNGLFAQIQTQLGAMQKSGGLNVATSRWNDFLLNKIGSADDDYTKLHVALDLLSTKMMQVHTGGRGAVAMMEHFKNMADAGKMDTPTLLNALSVEYKYAREMAMIPPKKAAAPAPANVNGGQ